LSHKILFVAMQMSIHVARWIRSIENRGWDLYLFPVNSGPVMEELNNITVYRPFLRLQPRLLQHARKRRSKARGNGRLSGISQGYTSAKTRQSILHLPVLKEFERYIDRIFRIRIGESRTLCPSPMASSAGEAYSTFKTGSDSLHRVSTRWIPCP